MWFRAFSNFRTFLIEADSVAGAERSANLVAVEGESIRRVVEVKAFATEPEAVAQFWDDLGDEDFVDNFRKAYEDDSAAMAEYEAARDRGCCGSFDSVYMVAGRLLAIGCNYGH